MSAFNKSDLIDAISAATGLARTDANRSIDAFIAAIRDQVEAGNVVKITGFGKFEMRTYAARTSRNPQTGEAIQVPESRKLVFRASKAKPASAS